MTTAQGLASAWPGRLVDRIGAETARQIRAELDWTRARMEVLRREWFDLDRTACALEGELSGWDAKGAVH
jgi:hypothetical protein